MALISGVGDQLFTDADLEAHLQQTLEPATIGTARRMAAGWLSSATGLTAWPNPVPDDLWGWAVELAGLIYDNPARWSNDTTGGTATGYERGARDTILDAARARYGPAASLGSGNAPLGCFPPAQPWPDPIRY